MTAAVAVLLAGAAAATADAATADAATGGARARALARAEVKDAARERARAAGGAQARTTAGTRRPTTGALEDPPGIPAPPSHGSAIDGDDREQASRRSEAWQDAVDRARTTTAGDIVTMRGAAIVIGAGWLWLLVRRRAARIRARRRSGGAGAAR